MRDGRLLLNALNKQWLKYRKNLHKCRRDGGEAAIHKLRTSTRRFLSLIELLLALTPDQDLQKLRKALKTQLKAFNALRDTQVMLLEISSNLNTLPELLPFLHQLHIDAQQLLMRTPGIIKDLDNRKLRQRLKTALHNLEPTFATDNLKQTILAAIDTAYQSAMERYRAVDPSQPDSLHRLRITLKKIRYMLISATELLPALPSGHLDQMQNYLTRLGDIQNACVLQSHLTSFYGDQPPASIQHHYQQRHNDLIQAYLAKRGEIMQFWRQNADRNFPWEA